MEINDKSIRERVPEADNLTSKYISKACDRAWDRLNRLPKMNDSEVFQEACEMVTECEWLRAVVQYQKDKLIKLQTQKKS